MRLPLFALALAVCLSGCALKKKEGYSTAFENPDLVCENVPVAGKIYPSKLCMTPQQWAQHKEEGSKAAAEAQRRSLSTAAPGGGG